MQDKAAKVGGSNFSIGRGGEMSYPPPPPPALNKVPGLAVVIVGQRKDSQTYVNMKKKACKEVGIESFGCDLPETVTQQELLAVVEKYNADPNVHGILVQLPVSTRILRIY